MAGKQQVPAIDGWFTVGNEPRLIGTRCSSCGTYFFPRASGWCRNPDCDGTELIEVELSRTGTVWSFTTNHYQPPAPFVAPDPFVPYTVAAVELADEKMVVLGQVVSGAPSLRVGEAVELVLDTLFEDDDNEYLVWKWSPVS